MATSLVHFDYHLNITGRPPAGFTKQWRNIGFCEWPKDVYGAISVNFLVHACKWTSGKENTPLFITLMVRFPGSLEKCPAVGGHKHNFSKSFHVKRVILKYLVIVK